jgi:hypothetical protein
MAGSSKRLTSRHFKQGNIMKKIVIASALLMISASAHAGTYSYQGVTVHVQDGCRSSSCVSVYAPGYGYYHAGHQAKAGKVHKDVTRFASTAKKEDAVPAPAVEATPAKAAETAPEAAPPAAPADIAPAK